MLRHRSAVNNVGSHAWLPEESLLLCNCIPKGNMKPELNQTQACNHHYWESIVE